MRLLLDTHAFLWFIRNDSRLSSVAAIEVADPGNDVFVSPASYWEIAIKVAIKKLQLHGPFLDVMDRGIVGNDFEILPIEVRHAELLTSMPAHHRDSFDRMLVAQSLSEGMSIVSNDAMSDACGVVRIW